MKTVTKKELIDKIAEQTRTKRVMVKKIIQRFLDEIVSELGYGNRLEFRDFGVFETRERAARIAQNPKTLEPVRVPGKRTVKFKIGRMMKLQILNGNGSVDGHTGDGHLGEGPKTAPQGQIGLPPAMQPHHPNTPAPLQ